ncbi:MAG TPA: hypothetical protein VLJ40_03320 [Arthrobacter sp.]|jgi:hypothetical protein|nr:hypothetical protein [Arthrobacter sp.]
MNNTVALLATMKLLGHSLHSLPARPDRLTRLRELKLKSLLTVVQLTAYLETTTLQHLQLLLFLVVS